MLQHPQLENKLTVLFTENIHVPWGWGGVGTVDDLI